MIDEKANTKKELNKLKNDVKNLKDDYKQCTEALLKETYENNKAEEMYKVLKDTLEAEKKMMLIKYQLFLMIKCQLMNLIQKAGKNKDMIQKTGKSKDRIPKAGKNKESTQKRRAKVWLPTLNIHVINVI